MTTPTAREMIRMEYGTSKNFFTDRVLKVGKIGLNRAYELSTGEGLFHQQVWGVSVVDYDPVTEQTTRRVVSGRCFHSHYEATAYIDRLKIEYNLEV